MQYLLHRIILGFVNSSDLYFYKIMAIRYFTNTRRIIELGAIKILVLVRQLSILPILCGNGSSNVNHR